MWALCPPSYHDNDMPIDLRKKVVVQRELEEKQEFYRGSEDEYAPKDYSLKDSRDSWQQTSILPVNNLHPFVSQRHEGRYSNVPQEEKPQDLRPVIRGSLETAIKKLHNSKFKQTLDNGKEQRCKSTDALLGKENGIKRTSRSNSCPDLTIIEQETPSNSITTPPSNGIVIPEIKNYSKYNECSPEHNGINSPVIGGARKRKSFVPLYGDRAPVFERAYRSPSPQNLVCNDKVYRSPSPKRPIYIHNGYHSPSPEYRMYRERTYRSPSPKRPVYNDRHYYSPSPTRPTYDEQSYHSPSPVRPTYDERSYNSPPPKRLIYDERSYHTPSPKRPIHEERSFHSPSPVRRPKSPPEQPPYEEYFSHPEVLLRRQLGHQNTSPYFLHVYDYYQHLVQRLREQSSPSLRISSPVSPTPIEEDAHLDSQRKRPCRALTGKHVRQGTGASLSTLLTLRQKIQERQKAKEHQPRTALNGIINKTTAVRKSNPKKMKLNTKSPLGKMQNC